MNYRTSHPEVSLLLYVDDLLIASKDQNSCLQATRKLLQALDQLGYKVSAIKAHIYVSKVMHLGYILKEGKT